jgi:hypothetical protein
LSSYGLPIPDSLTTLVKTENMDFEWVLEWDKVFQAQAATIEFRVEFETAESLAQPKIEIILKV